MLGCTTLPCTKIGNVFKGKVCDVTRLLNAKMALPSFIKISMFNAVFFGSLNISLIIFFTTDFIALNKYAMIVYYSAHLLNNNLSGTVHVLQ